MSATRISTRQVGAGLSSESAAIAFQVPLRLADNRASEVLMCIRLILVIASCVLMTGCSRIALDRHMENAYSAYNAGNCPLVTEELSQAERNARSRPYMQPEISLLRGLCLERLNYYQDAAQTYGFIIDRYAGSEYAYRAKARLETLRNLRLLTNDSGKL